MTLAIWILIAVGIIEVGASVRLFSGLRRLDRVDERLAHLNDALGLLAETTEAGLRANAQQLARLSGLASAPAPAAEPRRAASDAPVRAKARRAVTAVRKGRSLKDVAAADAMSEGELRLRVHLAETAARAATRDGARAIPRA